MIDSSYLYWNYFPPSSNSAAIISARRTATSITTFSFKCRETCESLSNLLFYPIRKRPPRHLVERSGIGGVDRRMRLVSVQRVHGAGEGGGFIVVL
jgi:hypothetical protein